jgi:hypothetical protein
VCIASCLLHQGVDTKNDRLIYACGGLAVEEGSPAAVTAAAAMSALATAAATPLDAGIVSEPVYATEATSGHHHHHHHHHHRHLLQANVESDNPWLVSRCNSSTKTAQPVLEHAAQRVF